MEILEHSFGSLFRTPKAPLFYHPPFSHMQQCVIRPLSTLKGQGISRIPGLATYFRPWLYKGGSQRNKIWSNVIIGKVLTRKKCLWWGKGARKTSVGNKELRSFTLNNLGGGRERVKDAETRIPSRRTDRFHIGFLPKSFSLLKLLVNDNRRTDVWNEIQPLFNRILRNVKLPSKWKLCQKAWEYDRHGFNP